MSDVLRSLDEARVGGRAEEPGDPLMRDLIGDLLRRTRTEQGRTLREVAEDAQVSLPYLSEIERGRKEASSEVLAAVYRSLGLSLSDVLGELYERTVAVRLRRTGTSLGDYRPAAASPAAVPVQRAQVLSLAA
ncbi:transcriptional regulator [Nocardiopsis sp. TSRI0078]|uniref:helix-turn-helix domain-containing protein n=1 Tax=unclassified Nocardiopsis TaxID=2649073 RepID=UPI00093B77BE|nr:helix-turn-helix transcriptional regulator [Nocardiopsis sp. TSRI0078]OKI23875.1 transcriptional regulator [Nocardiopsis sp. TSRI0078]